MRHDKVSGEKPGGLGETRGAAGDARPPGEGSQPPDARAFRRTMGMFATGVSVITTRVNEDIHGMTASSVDPVSLHPLLVMVSIARSTRMYRIMHQAGTFAINILRDYQEELSRHFAGVEAGPQPESLHFEPEADDGAPFIRDTLGGIRCRIEREVDVGDHVIVLGRVVQLREAPPAPPLIYFGGHYRSLRDVEAPDSAHDVWNPDAVRVFTKPSPRQIHGNPR
jgi:flavin reductase (DIM6/NTAB) family NADH-FMN oxidoreductase RutF